MNMMTAIILTTIATSTPLILAALGGVVSERAGVVNIGIEGMILLGAFFGMMGSFYTGNAWVGVVMAMLAGALMALVHAFISVTCAGNQPVSSTGIILFSAGITSYGINVMFGRSGNSDPVAFLPRTAIFEKIPVVGPYMANYSPIVYMGFLLFFLVYYVTYHTPLGLRLKTVGENPIVADSLGIDVRRLRYGAVVVSGLLAGLAGGYLSLGQMNIFQDGMSAGRGYLALAAVIMGRWKPQGAFFAALFFSFFDALSLQLQMMQNIPISHEFIQLIPYVATLGVLAFSPGKGAAPASNGKPYLKRG